jgi:hypothetical protein
VINEEGGAYEEDDFLEGNNVCLLVLVTIGNLIERDHRGGKQGGQ